MSVGLDRLITALVKLGKDEETNEEENGSITERFTTVT